MKTVGRGIQYWYILIINWSVQIMLNVGIHCKLIPDLIESTQSRILFTAQ